MTEMKSDKKQTTQLQINFTSSKWDYITVTREFLQNYLESNFLENEHISKIDLALSEVLENAIKYSTDKKVDILIQKDNENKHIFFTITNRATRENIKKAVEIIDIINSSDNVFLLYISRLRDKKARSSGESGGLGLTRISAEAGISLSHKIDEDESTIKIIGNFNY